VRRPPRPSAALGGGRSPSGGRVTVRVNGRRRNLPEGATVADAVRLLGVGREEIGVAAAVDGDVVPRDAWGRTPLREGTAVEVVRAAAGG